MKIDRFEIPGPLLIKPSFYKDRRGWFSESFNLGLFQKKTGFNGNFVQDNESISAKNVLRGLHFQVAPMAQGKLVRVVSGSIFDVAVDIDFRSASYGKYISVKLSAENGLQLWLPPNFAHGFLSLQDQTRVLYKTTNYYSPEHERGIKWDDKDLGIKWPIVSGPIVSEKDELNQDFNSTFSKFS